MKNTVTITDCTTREAAQYCGLSLRGFIYHVRQGHVTADRVVGRSNMYRRATLDKFNASRRKAGRPRKEQAK